MKKYVFLIFMLGISFTFYTFAQEDPGTAIQLQRESRGEPVMEQFDIDQAFETGVLDLFILKPRKLFSFEADTTGVYTNNALASDASKKKDRYWRQEFAFAFATQIAETYNVSAKLAFDTTRYDNNSSLDYDLLLLNIGANRRFHGFMVGGNIEGDIVKERGFDGKIINQLTPIMYAAYPHSIDDRTAIIPRAHVSRTFTTPGDYRNTRAGVGASLIRMITREIKLETSIDLTKRWYDSYFSSYYSHKREDNSANFQAGLTWQPVDYLKISAEGRVGFNNSTIASLDAHETSFSPSLNFQMKF
uniref:Uncharacterized protein n=1 Tax=Candidatus Kentrum sp. LPFa TaxID=2126335 RepID=A0A450VV92_9GAMM|nr:MAG: hypothetical protein BECKLPF1236A_GA0070988_100206 [Candidatus Kentron sp. LPFa]VFK25835.1 MAG: hypothetical protein BECKLPF1236C_GA0070990_100267 [Candidatus Kentron sp. LPFa]